MLKIAELLSCGQHNAIGLKTLMNLTGLDGRTVRKMIEFERRAGSPILSDNTNGYYLPETPEEKDRCVHSLRHRAMEIARTADAIDRASL